MSQEAKYIQNQSRKVFSFMRNQPIGYLITILFISLIAVGVLSVFGMVSVSIYVHNVLIDSFFWLDFIYQNFWFFILLYAIMLSIALVLKRRNINNVHVGTLETDEVHAWQLRIIFISIITVLLIFIILHLTGTFKIHLNFSIMVITPNNLAEQVIRQMYNLIWMAFCAFGIAIIVVN